MFHEVYFNQAFLQDAFHGCSKASFFGGGGSLPLSGYVLGLRPVRIRRYPLFRFYPSATLAIQGLVARMFFVVEAIRDGHGKKQTCRVPQKPDPQKTPLRRKKSGKKQKYVPLARFGERKGATGPETHIKRKSCITRY